MIGFLDIKIKRLGFKKLNKVPLFKGKDFMAH
jgi:hypothetical protein